MNPCLNFFRGCVDVDDVAPRLQAEADAVAWEKLTASEHSPGPVDDTELVLRLVFHPIHVDSETGDLKPSVVQEAATWGCSIQRQKYCPIDEAWTMGEIAAKAKSAETPERPRAIHAVAVLKVAQIRSLLEEERRALAVYDTALPSNYAHSDLLFVAAGKAAWRSARAKLFEWVREGTKLRDSRP